MHRTEAINNAGGMFTDGPPGTYVTADWLNAVQEEICTVIESYGGIIKSNSQDTSYDQLYTSILGMIESRIPTSARELYVRYHGGFHGDIVWKDSDEIVIKCKHVNGLGAWIGVFLNDNTYVELMSDYTIKYDTPANSGHILDDITAKLNNEWFIVWAYQDTYGSLSFGITWMPNYLLDTANPTNVLTPHQINGQDACYLVPVGAHLALFQDTDEWETPLAWQNAGAITYDATKDKPKVAGRNATTIMLGANLENNDFTHNTAIYQVDGFKPLQVSDGNVASAIGANGYKDIGFRFRTDGSGNIYKFMISGDEFIYINGSGAASYTSAQGHDATNLTATLTVYRMTFTPPDKVADLLLRGDNAYIATAPYYASYSEAIASGVYMVNMFSGSLSGNHSKMIHQLIKAEEGTGQGIISTRGFFL